MHANLPGSNQQASVDENGMGCTAGSRLRRDRYIGIMRNYTVKFLFMRCYVISLGSPVGEPYFYIRNIKWISCRRPAAPKPLCR